MSELNRLRCQLRALNIEYSELVRRKRAEVTYGRMAGLHTERCVLMALIAVERQAWQDALCPTSKSRQLPARAPAPVALYTKTMPARSGKKDPA